MLGQVITGDENDNNLVGGDGDDVINGLGGGDMLTGGLGDDTLNGGEGVDTAAFDDIDVPVTVSLNADGSGTATRETGFSISFDDVEVASLIDGQDDAAFVAEAVAGNLYFNIHTNDFNGGEIRGQLDEVVSDTTSEGGVRTIELRALLDAAQEPGPTSDSLATGEGLVTIVVQPDGSASYSTDLSVSGLATTDLLPVAIFSAIHLHNAPRGVNGPVALDVVQEAGGDVNGNALTPEAGTRDGDVFEEIVETDTLTGIENILGSDDDDEIIASGGAPNELRGGAGDDVIAGGGGTD
ncbi:MAG: CHRD domain-containing protein, partial [Pseudomonadota bacterium]